jgi:hypothetical protein
MVSHLEGRTQIEDVSKQGAEGNTWTKRKEVNEDTDHCIIQSFLIYTIQQTLLG